jgi:outer membrane protein assembly factor BamA
MKMKAFRWVGLSLLIVVSTRAQAQSSDCVDSDIKDFFGKKGKPLTSPVIVVKKPTFILFPVLASSPATGFQFGVAGQAAWFNDKPDSTRISQTSANVTITGKKQLLFTMKSTILGRKDKWMWLGDWRYYVYSQSTYGLGTNSPVNASVGDGINVGGVDTESNPGEEPMEYLWLRLHETAMRQVWMNFYAGVGCQLDYFADIRDNKLDVANNQLTEHYKYSVAKGFDPTRYTISGLSLNLIYDSRDNQINPYKGFYAHGMVKYNNPAFGSTQSSGTVWLEARKYKSLSKTKPRHMLAAWAFTNFVAGGNAPYLALPGANYDMRNRSARAYVQGRFRGEDMAYAELEYRFPISKCSNILGGVVFVNGITTSSRDASVKLFDYTKAGYGFGLRIAADKFSRTNIAVDVGFGEHSTGIYFGAAEVF